MDRDRKRRILGENPWNFYARNAGIDCKNWIYYAVIKRIYDGEPVSAKRLA
jgi:hypothetical protein